jgi:hypothetical protein
MSKGKDGNEVVYFHSAEGQSHVGHRDLFTSVEVLDNDGSFVTLTFEVSIIDENHWCDLTRYLWVEGSSNQQYHNTGENSSFVTEGPIVLDCRMDNFIYSSYRWKAVFNEGIKGKVLVNEREYAKRPNCNENIKVSTGLNIQCDSCKGKFPPYVGVPVPRLCPECQAIEDNGGKVTGNGAGELCSRCAMDNKTGWLCPACHDRYNAVNVERHEKFVSFAKTIDGLTLRNAELITEKRDVEQERNEAIASRENWHERYRNISEQAHNATKGDCCRCVVDRKFGWLCPACHEEMAGWVEGMAAKRKALEVLLAGDGRELPEELKQLDLTGIVNSRQDKVTDPVVADLGRVLATAKRTQDQAAVKEEIADSLWYAEQVLRFEDGVFVVTDFMDSDKPRVWKSVDFGDTWVVVSLPINDELAKWIQENIPGEPSQPYGAAACAIEIMKRQKEKIEKLENAATQTRPEL